MVRQRVRIRFSKSGNLKYIGHKDLLRAFVLLFRRAGLPFAMSGGFHPKIKMSFPSALALGIEGFDEVLELELKESVDDSVLLADLNRQSIDGLKFLSARVLNEVERKGKLLSSIFELTVPEQFRLETKNRIAEFLSKETVIVNKSNVKNPAREVDVRDAVQSIKFQTETGLLQAEIISREGRPEAGIRELLFVLNLDKEYFQTIFPKRIKCVLAGDDC
ncbi:MAG: TIGR03936 family radical SAM-associated protein [Planctomycetaceae bacterium]|jgi:radical SAM-linked protein|nr:TIGR03936 family radical SAM-associated protein [Planctomycetaceae bacterium]